MSDFNLKIILTTNGSTTTLEPISGTPASVELSGLSTDTDYEVEVILQRDGGNIDVASDSETFRTLSGDIDENTPFYLENLTENDASFTLTKTGTPTSTDLSYSLDNETWNAFDLTLAENAVKVPANGKIYLRSSTGFSNSTSNYFTLGMSEQFKVCGNIQYLLDYNDLNASLTSYCFHSLFCGSEYLIDASSLNLPAMTLVKWCYSYMFRDCTSLTTAPELPATTLAERCYQFMFEGCSSLTTAPVLPATILGYQCYGYMFYNCTSLTTAPELPAITLKDNCYERMFSNCTSLTVAPKLPATTLKDSCYYNMFNGCTSLTTAPELLVTTLKRQCYASMFNTCTSLTTAPELPATTLEERCYQSMFKGCSSLKTAPELPATTLAEYCYDDMFYGCTSLTAAPALPATTLANSCYSSMFEDCTSLTAAPALPATTLAEHCYSYMFRDCTNLQSVTTYVTEWNTDNTGYWLTNAGTQTTNPTLYCPANSTIKDYTNNNAGIPTGWTQVDL